MKRSLLLAATALTIAACSGGNGGNPAAPKLRLGPKDGAWSERQALEGPMAVWGPPGLGREVLSVTCLPRPRRLLNVTLFAPASKGGKVEGGELMVRVDGKGVGVPLTPKDEGAAEARLPASDGAVAAWSRARSLRFELRATPGDGVETGPAADPLKRVLEACR